MSALQSVPPIATRFDVLPSDEYQALLSWALESEAALQPSRVTGDIHKPQGRRALSHYGPAPWSDSLISRVRALLPGIVADLGMQPFQASSFEVEFVAYKDQNFIARHRDTGTGASRHGEDRFVSILFYLYREPKAFEGGALRLWALAPADDGIRSKCDVEPVSNAIIAFPSWAIHEVLPVRVPTRDFRASRFAVNLWVRRAHSSSS
jgi:Rps23 Pro-64 3,4-dihydroxylase Tpa1-like proline 4-hydroxylase